MGLKLNIPEERIKKFSDFAFENFIKSHFEFEEKHIFPLMGLEHPLIKKARAEHRRICRLFTDPGNIMRSLSLLEEELDAHIRFEERVLFNEIQNHLSAEDLQVLETQYMQHTAPKFLNWKDEFWANIPKN